MIATTDSLIAAFKLGQMHDNLQSKEAAYFLLKRHVYALVFENVLINVYKLQRNALYQNKDNQEC